MHRSWGSRARCRLRKGRRWPRLLSIASTSRALIRRYGATIGLPCPGAGADNVPGRGPARHRMSYRATAPNHGLTRYRGRSIRHLGDPGHEAGRTAGARVTAGLMGTDRVLALIRQIGSR